MKTYEKYLILELDFKSEKEFVEYSKNHKVKYNTMVTIAGVKRAPGGVKGAEVVGPKQREVKSSMQRSLDAFKNKDKVKAEKHIKQEKKTDKDRAKMERDKIKAWERNN